MLRSAAGRAVEKVTYTALMALTRESIVTLGNKLAPATATFSRLRVLLLNPDVELLEVINLIRLDPALTFHVAASNSYNPSGELGDRGPHRGLLQGPARGPPERGQRRRSDLLHRRLPENTPNRVIPGELRGYSVTLRYAF